LIKPKKEDKSEDAVIFPGEEVTAYRKGEQENSFKSSSLWQGTDYVTEATPIKLTFNNIAYEVALKNSQETVKVLKNVSGYAIPGECLYVMGASGAGKTSLLNVLSDRVSLKDGAKLTGKVLMNDY